MQKLMLMNMKHADTFTSFLTKFNHKTTYLKLKSGAKRGLLMATYANTNGKIQLLADRLIPELKRVRELDMNFSDMCDWLKQQDINQLNDGLKAIKVKKIKAHQNSKESTDEVDSRKDQKFVDPNGLVLRAHYLCYNCSNYGHSAKDCLAPYCNQCDTLRPNHKSNACPKPIDRKKQRRKRIKIVDQPQKDKDIKSTSKNKKKRGLKSITTSSHQSDDEDEDSLRQDAETQEDDDESIVVSDEDEEVSRTPSRRTRSQRSMRMCTIKIANEEPRFIRMTSQRSKTTRALHDSGAQAHAARSKTFLSELISDYDKQQTGCTQLKGASGEDLKARAVGLIEGLDAPVIVANIEDDVIVSTSKLNDSQHWVIHPPTGLFEDVGVIVIKHNPNGNTGQLMTIGDSEMYSDTSTWNKYDVQVPIPDLSSIKTLLPCANNKPYSLTWTPISRIYGMDKLTAREQVLFQQRIYFASKQRMIWYAEHIPSFPL
jgi:hypothetical protein